MDAESDQIQDQVMPAKIGGWLNILPSQKYNWRR
jgi:hypothetical protein